MTPKKIIIIDDHKLFIDGLMGILSKYETFTIVLATTDSSIAKAKILENPPDLIITDISMPHYNGLELIRDIKEAGVGSKILVISMFGDLKSFNDINGYLLKECSEHELITAINTILFENKNYFNTEDSFSESTYDVQNVFITKREKEVIQLIAKECTTEEIAEIMFISANTVATHRKNIFLKLGVNNIAGMVKKAMQLGYLK